MFCAHCLYVCCNLDIRHNENDKNNVINCFKKTLIFIIAILAIAWCVIILPTLDKVYQLPKGLLAVLFFYPFIVSYTIYYCVCYIRSVIHRFNEVLENKGYKY